MCLIAYSPNGQLLTKRVFDYARGLNSDGIGIMSNLGVAKFVGRRSGKRAWRYLRRLEGTEYGIHFRWATHGDVTRELAHPFESMHSDTYVMHNGIISRTAKEATSTDSDTSIFVKRYMSYVPEPGARKYKSYFDKIQRLIGYGNKLLVFHVESAAFTIANEDEGGWTDGIWYSNDYSLPYDMAFEDSYALLQAYGKTAPDDYSDRMVSDTLQAQNSYYAQLEREGVELADTGYVPRVDIMLAKCDDCGAMSLHAARVTHADGRKRCAPCDRDMIDRAKAWTDRGRPIYGVSEALADYCGEGA